ERRCRRWRRRGAAARAHQSPYRSQARKSDRRIGIVFRGGREHAADAHVADEFHRCCIRLRDRLDREADDRLTPQQGARISGAMSSEPTWTPSAPEASATSTRSLIRSGTNETASAASIARALFDQAARLALLVA